MGVVYLAEQEEPIRRTVALKLIKRGLDTAEVIARFAAERQALAVMDHPHIAHVYDAGATSDGRPYFVMEYVAGLPITEFADAHRLSTRRRVELVTQVCAAIQHAHQKGVIHRDLKPSNVLVTIVDGSAVPKVIDFGIAKATNQHQAERANFTRHGVMIGTPEYMSPEQADPGGLDIDTRTDVYSLGVILYELLAGVVPFGSMRLRDAAYTELIRIIREEEPQRPSTRISETQAPPTAGEPSSAEIAARRDTRPATLVQQLRGDLDWITLRALEKDRARRYTTVSDLAADLERFLRSEPVAARPPSIRYRVQKFVRRNRLMVTAASSVFLAIIAGLVVSSVLYLREGRARRDADAMRERAVVASASAETRAAEEARQRRIAEVATDAASAARARADEANQRSAAQRDVARAQLAQSLYQEAISVRLSGIGGRRWLALDALREAERIRVSLPAASKSPADRPTRPGDTWWSALELGSAPVLLNASGRGAPRSAAAAPAEWELRSQAVEALMLSDARITHAAVGPAAVVPPGMVAVRLGMGAGRVPAPIVGLRADSPVVFTEWTGGGELRGIDVFDYRSGRSVARLPITIRASLTSYALSPDGSTFASLVSADPGLWSLPAGTVKSPLKIPPYQVPEGVTGTADVQSASFDSSGRFLVAVRGIRVATPPAPADLLIWDVAAPGQAKDPTTMPIVPGGTFSMSADGRIAFASDPRTVRIVTLSDLKSTVVHLPGDYTGSRLSFDATGQWLATASRSQTPARTALQLWSTSDGRLTDTIEVPFSPQVVSLSRGKRLLAAQNSRDLVVIDVERRSEVLRFSNAWQNPLLELVWNDEATQLTSLGTPTDGLAVWEVQFGDSIRRVGPASGTMFGFDRTGTVLPVFTRQSTAPDAVRLLRSTDGSLLRELQLPAERSVGAVFLWTSADGRRIGIRTLVPPQQASTGAQRGGAVEDLAHVVRVLDAGTGKILAAKDFGSVAAGNGVVAGVFTPEGDLVVAYQPTYSDAVLWNVTADREIWRGAAGTPRFSANGRLFWGLDAGSVAIRNVAGDRIIARLPTARGERILDIDGNGTFLLTATEANSLVMRNLSDGRSRSEVPLESSRGTVSAALDPTGRMVLVAYSGGWVEFWRVQTGTKLLEWKTPLPQLSRVSFSPDGASVSLQGPGLQTLILNLSDLRTRLERINLNWSDR